MQNCCPVARTNVGAASTDFFAPLTKVNLFCIVKRDSKFHIADGYPASCMPQARCAIFLLVSMHTTAASQQLLQQSLQLAITAHKSHDLPVARKNYLAVLAINPSLPAIHNNLAAVQLAQGDKEGASASWQKAVELKPEYAEAHYNLAVLLSEQQGEEDTLPRAEHHCGQALELRPDYVQAHHLMGNILASKQQAVEATASYQKAAALANGAGAASGGTASGGEDGGGAAARLHRWDGVAVGHRRRVQLGGGRQCEVETLALTPLVLRVANFLDASECGRLVELASPRLQRSLVMGDAAAAERTSSSVFIGAAADPLLPLQLVQTSEDLQVVHYAPGQSFGMHHDSSSFQPRYLTAFYYLNDSADDGDGGETHFPAADGALTAQQAYDFKYDDGAAGEGGKRGLLPGLAVRPERGAALLWYNHDAEGALEPAAVHAGAPIRGGEKWGANHWVSLKALDSR